MFTTTFSSDLDWDKNGKLQRVSKPGSKKFVGEPSPEIDANWEHITNGKCPSVLRGRGASSRLGNITHDAYLSYAIGKKRRCRGPQR